MSHSEAHVGLKLQNTYVLQFHFSLKERKKCQQGIFRKKKPEKKWAFAPILRVNMLQIYSQINTLALFLFLIDFY